MPWYDNEWMCLKSVVDNTIFPILHYFSWVLSRSWFPISSHKIKLKAGKEEPYKKQQINKKKIMAKINTYNGRELNQSSITQ